MNSEEAGKKTALFDEHNKLGAKIVPFGGWLMPVSYESVLAEHASVRERCGIFDVSHMGEVRVRGRDAARYMQYLTINDASKLGDGQGQYSAILNDRGGFVDDLIVYRLTADDFLVCVNASNTDKDFSWFAGHTNGFQVAVVNESSQWSQLAIQGPQSFAAVAYILTDVDRQRVAELPYMGIAKIKIFDKHAFVARTGYTGEKGYEIYLPNEIAAQTWRALLNTASTTNIKPIGLGARDTLRLEAGYLLYGNDMNDDVTPLEAGIGWATRFDCGDFHGKAILEKQKATGLTRKLFAFKMEDNAIPRHEMAVFQNTEHVGVVTSGSVLPTVGGSGGMALLSAKLKEGDAVEIDVRGKRKKARLVKRPHYAARVK